MAYHHAVYIYTNYFYFVGRLIYTAAFVNTLYFYIHPVKSLHGKIDATEPIIRVQSNDIAIYVSCIFFTDEDTCIKKPTEDNAIPFGCGYGRHAVSLHEKLHLPAVELLRSLDNSY